MKSWRVRWTEHVAQMARKGKCIKKFESENLKGRHCTENLFEAERITLE
jgi:hypothetical protein